MRSKILSFVLLATLVGAALISTVPMASAQQSASLTIALTTPDSVKPLQGPVSFSGTATFIADYSGVTGVIGVPVTYTVTKQPAWAAVLVSPATDVFGTPAAGAPTGGSYTVTKTFSVTVTASDQAPAFQADTIEITATTTPTTNGKPAVGKGNVPITASFFSIIDVQLAEAIKVERPQTPVVFPVKVSNFGNANTKVAFEVVEKTESLEVPLPNPLTLQSKQAGGNQISADVPLTIQTPYKNGYMNEVGIVNYKITSSYALDPKLRGDESSVSVLVTTRGFYVPGPSPILLLGLVGAVALAIRRFR